MKNYLFILIFTFFLGCVGSTQNEVNQKKIDTDSKDISKTEESEESQPNKSETVYFDYSNSFFPSEHTKSVKHIFSNDTMPDIFLIDIPEGKIVNTSSTFSIISSLGDTIHFETFETSELIYGYALDQITTDEQVIEHIIDRVAENLDESSFINISTTEYSVITESTPDDFVDYETFINCKDSNLPIYQFTLGNENSSFFGYSQKERKAVPVIYCC